MNRASDTASGPQGVKRQARIALWDHARFVLIVGVVVGHLLTTVRLDNALAFALYVFIFLFHMPAMIFLSGLFSKAEVTSKSVRSTWQLVVVWIIWEALWAIIRFVFDDRLPGQNWLVVPAWTLWFLVSLATMRVLLPYLARLKHPLIVSIVLALAGGLAPTIGTPFSASRTLCFLPFFVAGWVAKERGWFAGDWFVRPSRAVQGAGIALLAVTVVALALIPNFADWWRVDKWLTWRDDYATLFDEAAPVGLEVGEFVSLAGIGIRLVLLVIAAVLTFAVLASVSRRETRVTVWGSRTLYVYLLHGPIVYWLRGTGALDWIEALGPVGIPLIVLLGIGIAMLLSTTLVTRILKPVIEPSLAWLTRSDPQSPTAARKL